MCPNHFSPKFTTIRSRSSRTLACVACWLGALAALVGATACGSDGDSGSDSDRFDDVEISGAAIDVHLHIASPELTELWTNGKAPAPTAAELVERLDEANIDRGVVLSPGFMYFFPDASYMAHENDYVSSEVSQYPKRLVGFCGINPLFDSASDEVDRCLDRPGMRGIKLHLPGSQVDLTNPEHVAALSAVFDSADRHDAPVLLHAGDAHEHPLESVGFSALSQIIEQHPRVRLLHAHCAGNTDDAGIEQWLRVPLARRA